MNHLLSDNSSRLAALRARIARMESIGGARAGGNGVVSLGAPEIDAALPWGGLPAGCLHEISGASERNAGALAFAAFLLARLAGSESAGPTGHRPVLWISPGSTPYAPAPYAPALPAFGLDPARVMLVRARRPVDALWALEEALRCPGLAGVLAEDADPDFPASRRLQLAASDSGVTALLLRPEAKTLSTSALPASAAVTRWRVQPLSSVPGPCAHGSRERMLGPTRWRLKLLRCRGGRPHEWQVEWRHETNRLRVVADACDRSSDASVRQEAA